MLRTHQRHSEQPMSPLYACSCGAVAPTPSRKRKQPWIHISCALLLCCKLASSLQVSSVAASSMVQSSLCSSRTSSSSQFATHRHAHKLRHSSRQLQHFSSSSSSSSSVDSASSSSSSTKRSSRKKKAKVPVHTLAEMDKLLQAGTPLFNLDVRGDSYEHLIERAEGDMHPVLEILRQRRECGSKPGDRSDAFKVQTRHENCSNIRSLSS
jgi:hypothetical protein